MKKITLPEVISSGRFLSRGRGAHSCRVIDSFELIIVESGTLKMFEEERQFSLGPGDYLILYPGRKHGGIGNYPPDLIFDWVHFGQPDFPLPPQQGKVSDFEQAGILFQLFLQEQEKIPAGQENRQLLLKLLLNGCISAGRTELSQSPLAMAAMKLIRRDFFREDCIPSRIAAQLQVSRDHLSRLFHAAYGTAPAELIHRLRLENAANLLQLTPLSVKEIASECGFSDLSYFHRSFRERYGVTPRRYRMERLQVHTNTE